MTSSLGKGKSYITAGYVYAPYVPLVSTVTIPTVNTRVNDKKSVPNYNLTILVARESSRGIRMGYDTFNIHLGQVLECYITEPANVSLGIVPMVTGNKFLVTNIWEYDLSRFVTGADSLEKDDRVRVKLVSLGSNTWGEGVVSFDLNFRQREPAPTDLEPGEGTAGGHICVMSGKNLREFIEKGNLRAYLK